MNKACFYLIIIIVGSTSCFHNTTSNIKESDTIVVEELFFASKKRQFIFSYNEFLDTVTGKFDSITAYNKLPWKIRDIYNNLNSISDIIYNIEEYDLRNNSIKSKYLFGFRMLFYNDTIESKMFNYSKNKYYGEKSYMRDSRGSIIELRTIEHEMKITENSTEGYLKFAPFVPLDFFRTNNNITILNIKNKSYVCQIAEGLDFLLPGDQWRIWMDKDSPGIIVKAIKENGNLRTTWVLDSIQRK